MIKVQRHWPARARTDPD